MACQNGSVVFNIPVLGGVITAPPVVGSLMGVNGTVIGSGISTPLAAGGAVITPIVLGGVVAECFPSGTVPPNYWATESNGTWLTESGGGWLLEIQ